ncbi:Aspartate--tRNA ligase, cytoplasmic [Geodia barretti]|uniref:Aspartyl-tRNA synthetase n=1 Tax=Geodia barretti TaxID=519541 RepID=A0AA35R1C4_GEOBA|nr:Aspartate--tRNA ligase, cytoplasmic [Geodia barretti]
MTTVNPSQTGLDEAGPPTSKKGLKKQQKEAEKAKRKAEVAAKLDAEAAGRQADDVSKDLYGIAPLIQSQLRTGRVWKRVGELTSDLVGQTVLVRARVHAKRGTGKLGFLVLRQQYHTVQAVISVSETISKQMVKFATDLHLESVVDVEGKVTAAPEKITGCTQQEVELQVAKVFCISQALPQLPLQIEDAMRPENSEDGPQGRVNQDTRLDNRIIDLRTTTNQAIFRVEAAVCRLFRDYLTAQASWKFTLQRSSLVYTSTYIRSVTV